MPEFHLEIGQEILFTLKIKKLTIMPCNSDYMDPTQEESNSLEVINFLKEVGEKVGKYNKTNGRVDTLDKDGSKLCSMCQKIDISKYS